MYPHRFVGVVGEHDDFGVDNLSVSHDGTLLASCASEEVVHFWNIEYLYDMDNEESKKVGVSSLLCLFITHQVLFTF
ncbi:WD repeat-containing protein 55 [Portunus trituberculatus]|uniref:WD repeat-containing protein 55 n=1 Tax=Portunus trituberculatus TaxID=210409 RepID=A0A5B7J7U3_PORTR|nr:WD repeat-containing protein 55 [Portunus trituberculatus]